MTTASAIIPITFILAATCARALCAFTPRELVVRGRTDHRPGSRAPGRALRCPAHDAPFSSMRAAEERTRRRAGYRRRSSALGPESTLSSQAVGHPSRRFIGLPVHRFRNASVRKVRVLARAAVGVGGPLRHSRALGTAARSTSAEPAREPRPRDVDQALPARPLVVARPRRHRQHEPVARHGTAGRGAHDEHRDIAIPTGGPCPATCPRPAHISPGTVSLPARWRAGGRGGCRRRARARPRSRSRPAAGQAVFPQTTKTITSSAGG